MNKKVFYVTLLSCLTLLALMSGAFFNLYRDRQTLAKNVIELRTKLDAKDKHALLNQGLFTHLESLAEESLRNVATKKEELRESDTSFVFADLESMVMELYKDDGSSTTLAILTKGREGSWWETPTGDYSVLGKESNHFSSIGNVWMPWSIQFYGNFFIHGWPYHEGGEPVPQGYSGGCIRLSTEDAKTVYDFVKKDTPILIREDGIISNVLPALETVNYTPIPSLMASSVLVADLTGKNVMLDKNGDKVLPVASLTKLMTAVVASELIYLERSVTFTSNILSDKIQSFPFQPGDRYTAFDLFYPMLMESSNGAAKAMSAFVGEGAFIKNMNAKAKSLELRDTTFADLSGVSDGNVSTARDLVGLSRYILDKRHFIFDITKGKDYLHFGPTHFTDLKNFNEFAADANLLGMKNGETIDARQTIVSLWQLRDKSGSKRTIAIVVLGSDDRKSDTEALLNWTKQSFGLE